MRAIVWSWLAAVMLAVGACGGSAFTSGLDGGASGGSSSGGSPSSSGGSGDGGGSGTDAGDGASSSKGGGTQCGPTLLCTGTGGQQGTICCVGSSMGSPQYQCAGASCGCDTQLECTSNADCGGSTPICCIRQSAVANCGGGHFVAKCSADCANGGIQACDPNAAQPTCASGQQCVTDATCVGLPPSQGFGVCGGC